MRTGLISCTMDPTYAPFGSQRSGRNNGPPISKPEPEPGACLMTGSIKFDTEIINFVLEDVRLSTLQKKLAKETSSTKQMALALQVCPLLTILLTHNNSKERQNIKTVQFYAKDPSRSLSCETSGSLCGLLFMALSGIENELKNQKHKCCASYITTQA